MTPRDAAQAEFDLWLDERTDTWDTFLTDRERDQYRELLRTTSGARTVLALLQVEHELRAAAHSVGRAVLAWIPKRARR